MSEQKYYKRTPLTQQFKTAKYFITEITKSGETRPLKRGRDVVGYRVFKFGREMTTLLDGYTDIIDTVSRKATTVPFGVTRKIKRPKKKKLFAYYSPDEQITYVLNEKGRGYKATLLEYGSCTPAEVMQTYLDSLPPKIWLETWKKCEKSPFVYKWEIKC